MEKNYELPYELFGIECGHGWNKLYQPIIDYIMEFNETHKDNPIIITQIKEKFGELRFYVSYGTKELYDMIDKAEEESIHTCEECGCYIDEPIEEHHWIYPLCDKCFKRLKDEQIY